jgi:hypothetical protein
VIARNGHQPAYGAVIAGNVAIGTLPNLDVYFLERLFGFCAVIQDTQAYAEEFRTGAPVEFLERGAIPQGYAGQESRNFGSSAGHCGLFYRAAWPKPSGSGTRSRARAALSNESWG